MDYAWVARKVGISLRNEILEFWHHRVVAPLTPAEQKDWLNKAATNGWSRPPERAAVLPGAGGRRLVLLHAVHRVRALQRPRTMPVVRPGAQAAESPALHPGHVSVFPEADCTSSGLSPRGFSELPGTELVERNLLLVSHPRQASFEQPRHSQEDHPLALKLGVRHPRHPPFLPSGLDARVRLAEPHHVVVRPRHAGVLKTVASLGE